MDTFLPGVLRTIKENMSKESFVPKTVTVSLGMKAKVGGANSYNMATVHYTLSGEVAEGASPEEAKEAAEAIVDGWVGDKLKSVQEANR